jgi:hypothetical protein
VPTSTLDDVLGARLAGRRALLIVDIEGAEKRMLDGAGLALATEPRPVWMVEIAVDEHQPAGTTLNPELVATFDAFWRRGYEAWTAQEHSRRIERDEVEAIARTGVNTLGTHNFLFIEAGSKPSLLP